MTPLDDQHPPPDARPTPQTSGREIVRVDAAGTVTRSTDALVIEEPLEIRIGFLIGETPARRSVSITMRTPGHDTELAVGFLYGEGILSGATDIARVGSCAMTAARTADGRFGGSDNVIRVDLAPGVEVDFERLQRHFYSTSSCGVCGKTSLEALAIRGATPFDRAGPSIDVQSLLELPARMRQGQQAFEATGGLHAAGLFAADGALCLLREDVGRHNAVDKVVGRRLLDRIDPAAAPILVVSGRTSFEILQKAVVARVPIVLAVGAPSTLAVELAEEFGMTLVGFLRDRRFNVYAGPERITGLERI